MNSQSSSQTAVDRLAFQRSLPSTPQHQRVVFVWLLRITASPAAVSSRTTASYTWSGVFPRSAGLAATESSVTGRLSWTISLENGSRRLLIPISRKPAMISAIGARSRPSGIRPEFSPAWWAASSSGSPEPFQVPLAPCQLPERSLKRSPSASTIQRPRVLSGGVQSSAGRTGAAVADGSDAAPGSAAATGRDVRGTSRSTAARVALTKDPRTVTIPVVLSWMRHELGLLHGNARTASAHRDVRQVEGVASTVLPLAGRPALFTHPAAAPALRAALRAQRAGCQPCSGSRSSVPPLFRLDAPPAHSPSCPVAPRHAPCASS